MAVAAFLADIPRLQHKDLFMQAKAPWSWG